jgi:2-hydroxymuconate-semialdehyde hydrolase
VFEGGAGEPLVLLHGAIECGGAYWGPVVPGLGGSQRLVIPDAPGLGESEPVDRLDPARFAEWLAKLLELTCHVPHIEQQEAFLTGLRRAIVAS